MVMTCKIENDLKDLVKNRNLDKLEEFLKEVDDEKLLQYKKVVSHLFYENLNTVIADGASLKLRMSVIHCAAEAERRNLLPSPLQPLNMINILFETCSLNEAGKAFDIITKEVDYWRKFRNSFLRVCNDLLRRFSRLMDTGASGKVLIFMARVLPLSERSGLNIIGAFSASETPPIDNINMDEKDLLTPIDDMPSDEIKKVLDDANLNFDPSQKLVTTSLPVTYGLYRKFWRLQDFFAHQTLAFDNYSEFTAITNEVLSMFDNYKVEANEQALRENEQALKEATLREAQGRPAKRARLDDSNDSAYNLDVKGADNEAYFAKYLSGQRLLQLQLNDSQFRRYILVQFLITFQWLRTGSRFSKGKALPMGDKGILRTLTAKCHRLIRETPPNGAALDASIRRIMEREEHWTRWKEANCLDFTARPLDKDGWTTVKRAPRRLFKVDAKVDLGMAELNRLWSLPHNLESCSDPTRNYLPKPTDFFYDYMYDIYGKSSEEKVLSGLDEQFEWRAARYLLMNRTVRPVMRHEAHVVDAEIDQNAFDKKVMPATPVIINYAVKYSTECEKSMKALKDTIIKERIDREKRHAEEEAREKAEQERKQRQDQEETEKAKEAAKQAQEAEAKRQIESGNMEILDEVNDDDDNDTRLISQPLLDALTKVLSHKSYGNAAEKLALTFKMPDDLYSRLKKKSSREHLTNSILLYYTDELAERATVSKLRRYCKDLKLYDDKLEAIFNDHSLDAKEDVASIEDIES